MSYDIDSTLEATPDPIPQTNSNQTEQTDPLFFFFMVSATVLYKRENSLKQRQINIRLELDNPNITLAVLAQINRAIIGRIMQEFNIPVEDVKDIIINNISILGAMTKEQFYAEPEKGIVDGGTPPEPLESHVEAPQGTEAVPHEER